MLMKRIVGAAVAAALLFAIPVPAHADVYLPNQVAQDFAGSTGGWHSTTAFEGPCDVSLLCPTVVNGFAAGGADGNGFLSTRFGSLLTTTAGTSTGVWESPAFVYHGLGGTTPAQVTFDLKMLSDVGALLVASVSNNSSFRVDLVDQGTGNQISVVPPTTLSASTAWTAIPTASVNPSLVQLEHSYTLKISTSYSSGVAVDAQGTVGYDNVRLTTRDQNGNSTVVPVVGPNGGSGITTRKELRKLAKTFILPDTAKVVGNKLKMKLRCPAKAAPLPCKIQVTGLSAGKFSKAATARKVASIKANKKKKVKIRIKQQYVASYQSAKKIWVKSTVRVGKIRVTVRKRVKLV